MLVRMMIPLVILALMLGMARIFLDLKGVFLILPSGYDHVRPSIYQDVISILILVGHFSS